PRVWWTALGALVVGFALMGHPLAVQNEGWGTSGDRMSLAFLRGNLATNGWFYLWDERFPVLYTLLAALGIVVARPLSSTTVAISFFTSFWVVFLFFYAGSYNYGADVRYSLMTYIPLAVLAGAGCAWIADRLRPLLSVHQAGSLVAGVLLLQFSWYLPGIRAVGEEAWAARADVAHAREFADDLPVDSIVLTHNPSMFHLWGRNAAQASLALTDPGMIGQWLFERYGGGVYFHWDFWCNVDDPARLKVCQDILASFPHRLVRERHLRTFRYALYRIEAPTSHGSPNPSGHQEARSGR
ncbi:MAG: hypothetical protein ACRD1T_23255, partial [Acidimicrobiia bacterium]